MTFQRNLNLKVILFLGDVNLSIIVLNLRLETMDVKIPWRYQVKKLVADAENVFVTSMSDTTRRDFLQIVSTTKWITIAWKELTVMHVSWDQKDWLFILSDQID